MKKFFHLIAFSLVAIQISFVQAAILTVNTADNTDFGVGKTNLVTAINNLADGDTIRFNIPGAGPQYLLPPPGGYPVITNKHNITIDGYSQPGAVPNSNPILAPNNAQIKIVLDGRSGDFTSFPEDIPGYGTSEVAILFVLGSTNFTVQGICFLGAWDAQNSETDQYALAFGGDEPSDNAHVSGCRFGLDLDNVTVARLKDAVTAFGSANNGIIVGVAPGAEDAAAARAQFNVIIAPQIGAIIEGNGTRISGNFFNVYPDGIHDFYVDGGVTDPSRTLEAFIEIGSYGNNVVIGTDGDGRNDAEERNVFGGVTDADDNNYLEWYGGTRTNTVIAGNYIGVGVDGLTVFTNGGPNMTVMDGFNSTTTARVGSDFDGVSDAIEGNVIFWNHPFADLYPDPPSTSLDKHWEFANLSAGALVSFRGNKLVNGNLAPYSYADGFLDRLDSFTNYESLYMVTTGDIIPILATNSIFPRLTGTCATGVEPYTNIIIDVYQMDPEGWTNGAKFALAELLAPDGSSTSGFAQGKNYLGSFVDNGPQDSDPAIGSFSFDISALDVGPGPVTVTANYSADPPKTHNARTHTSNFSNPISLIPAGVSSVGLTHIVPDMLLWYNSAGYYTNGPVNPADEVANLQNWEPYISVLGDSTFLIGATTFADDQTAPANATATAPFQRFVVTFQPVTGGAPRIGEEFFADDGSPFRGVINLSRENGNPQRVAGDKRVGATNFLSAAETSAGQLGAFQSDSRWTSNLIYQADNRYVTVQPFSLDPATLAQTPLHKAFDAVYGNYADDSTVPGGGAQISRTGGRPEALDNGNFVVVWDDKTTFVDPAGEVTTFAIITPTGAVVKSATLVDAHDIWDNVAAYKGGFAVRVHNLLYFYDNAGNPTHTNDINISSGLSFGAGREDASRIGSDIRSDYVYLAGQTPESGNAHVPVDVAIWDARTGEFITSAVVETDPGTELTDRATVAVDALNRFCVAYVLKPNSNFANGQVAARILNFDGTNITYLTHSFFPFVNYDPDGSLGLTTLAPSVAMTTEQICIAAKGTVNSNNTPAGGPDTKAETTLYTVISMPIHGDIFAPQLTVSNSGTAVTISWSPTGGTLQSTPVLNGPATVWTAVGSANPATITVGSGNRFYRVQK